MERQYVESSMIESVGYDTETSTLEIEFKKNGAVWQYYDISGNLYYEFIGNSSLGKFFLEHIRGQYTENRIG